LLYDITHQKPTVALKPGIFYSGIDGFFIKVTGKDDKTNTLNNITVYDHTSGRGDDHVITATKGSMNQDEEQMALTLHLENGRQYREIDPRDPNSKDNPYEMVSTSFQSWDKRFDLSQFKLTRTDENLFKGLKQMMNLQQLVGEIDTMKSDKRKLEKGLADYGRPYTNFKRYSFDTLKILPKVTAANFKNTNELVSGYDKNKRIQIMESAMNKARTIKNFADITAKQIDFKDNEMTTHYIEVYRKFTLSIACLVLFFIGAPLGSIIRKGGLGWPLFYCVLFFIIYHVTSMIGEKLAENNIMTSFGGMWLSTFVLLPAGLFLTLKAASDSKLFSTDYYNNVIRSIFSPKAQAN